MSRRWDGIDEVVAVADTGSYVGAARRLASSTSQVSRAVVRLEQSVGVQVFHRTTRAVTLTEAGRTLVDRFRRLIAERDEAVAELGLGAEPQGTLRLTCSVALGERFIAPIVLGFMARYPRLAVEVDLSNRVIDIAGEGFDLAIRTGSMPDTRLIRTQIASRRILTCAAPSYLAARGVPLAVEDLERHDCVLGSVDTWHFRVGGVTRAIKPKGRFRCDNGAIVTAAAIAGLGICHLPEFYVHQALADGRLASVLDMAGETDDPVWAVYPERRHLLPKVQLLIEALRRELGPMIRGDKVR